MFPITLRMICAVIIKIIKKKNNNNKLITAHSAGGANVKV